MDHWRRDQIDEKLLTQTIGAVVSAIDYRIKSGKTGLLASIQEIMGAIRYETVGFEALLSKSSSPESREEALRRIAVAAILGIVSHKNGRLDL